MIYSYAAAGFSGQLIHVECSIRRGMPSTEIVGLPDGAVKEARERVRTVLLYCGFLYPNDRILINLAPAGVKKTGAGFDLPIALAILLQDNQLAEVELPPLLVLGELELSGRVRSSEGVLAAVASAHELGIQHFLVPQENLAEAESLAASPKSSRKSSAEPQTASQTNPVIYPIIYPLAHITELPQRIVEISQNIEPEPILEAKAKAESDANAKEQSRAKISIAAQKEEAQEIQDDFFDFADIKGLPILKRAIEIALIGRHNMLIFGPPGCGKTMAVRSLPSLLPPLDQQEAVETTRIWSQAGLMQQPLMRRPPLRMPHHSATLEGLVGGGPKLSPGEVSLAHNGILFLDEAPEFKASHLQGLREPIENQRIAIVRAGKSFWYPADFQLFMAINPCPCGNLGREENICSCSQNTIAKYWKRVGGALLDRIDMRIPVSPTSAETLLHAEEESSAAVRKRIEQARQVQRERFEEAQHRPYNARIPAGRVTKLCKLDAESQELFTLAVKKFGLSSRACHSVLRIARSIADLEGCKDVEQEALLEAIEYRRYGDRNIFWESF